MNLGKRKNIITTLILSSTTMLTNHVLADETSDQITETMVVTAKSLQPIEDQGISVDVITSEQISQSNALSIKDILVETAGVNLTINSSSISGRQNISIRGSNSDHVLILVDGMKVSGTDAQIGHSDFQYNWIPMNAIERIEVIKGPMSSLYGSEALGGVINIITKKYAGEFSGNIDAEYGVSSDDGGDLLNAKVNASGNVTDKLSLFLSAERLDLEETEDEDDSTETKIEGKEVTNGMVRFKYDLDTTQSIDGSISVGSEDRKLINDELYYEIERYSYALGYSKEFDTVSLDLDGYVIDSDTYYTTGAYTHSLTNSAARAEVGISSFDNHYLVTGAEYKLEEYDKVYDTSSVNDFNDDIYTASIFAQDEYELTDDLILTLGARYDYHERFKGEFSPKVNILYKIDEHHRVRAGYGEGFKAPTVTQNSSSYSSTSHFTFYGNDDLEAETSKSFEVGYEYNSTSTVVKAAVFYSEVDDLITSEKISTTEYQYVNVDGAKIVGFEFELSQDITENHNLSLTYHHLDTEDEESGEDLSYRPDNTLTARLTSNLPYGIEATFAANYTGEQYSSDETYDDYTIYSAQLSKLFFNKLTARIGVDNLSDEDLDGVPYDIKGRLIYAGLNYAF
ncbi:hypothetical protein CSW98_04925 [Vibrio sp. HA2012]|uniref:TonB-dependent receptor plug domain-containing protein n=1 Tax=Vibrio sp. HA2012 TaxID=1971595 RepID=UPI000C2C22B1|nr:TonB-dependent receptor [Vibrio sp. HA2012]PJC87248.1 hypothetical protein CSW98_04925 [Vibrio sp. HA2012]